jgi:membrane protein DedA with SNARE-associated domain
VESLWGGLAGYLTRYGYWTVAAALLLENAGLPVPGETVLIAASALAHSTGTLELFDIIVVGSLAATVGDNLGYLLGRSGGRPLLDRVGRFFRLDDGLVARGERLFERYGAATIFFARFVAGLRVIAGPLAGVLGMPWRRFAVFNALGAVTWVTAIACAAYLLGRAVPTLARAMSAAGFVLLAVLVVVAVIVGRRVR